MLDQRSDPDPDRHRIDKDPDPQRPDRSRKAVAPLILRSQASVIHFADEHRRVSRPPSPGERYA